MRIYEERTRYKRETHCPTCGKEGHMWMTCPVPAQMMELKKKGKEPDVSLFVQWYAKSYGRRDNDGRLIYHDKIFRNMEIAYDRQQRRIQARKEKKDRLERLGVKPRRRKTSCGFCGDTGHNRRNCDVMHNFIDDLERASQNYRKLFYERIVKGLGFAEGALLSLSARQFRLGGRWVDDWSGVAIITSISWDKVNMGLVLTDWDYKSELKVEVLINGQTHTLTQPFYTLVNNDIDHNNKRGKIAELLSSGSSWGASIESILAPSENIPTEEWFNNGYTECWKWIAKNKNLGEVNTRLAPLIAKFHPSRRGRNAGKLKKRLSQYGYNTK